MRIGLLSLAGALLASGHCRAAAGRLDMTTLHARDSWEVLLTHDTLGEATWCSATTTNPARQWFSLVGFDSGELALFVGHPDWELAPRSIGFVLEVDRRRWSLGGEAGGSSVSVFLDGQDEAGALLADLRASAAVAVLTETSDPLAAFSLRGSRAAIDALADCALRIARPVADALPAPADPFRAGGAQP